MGAVIEDRDALRSSFERFAAAHALHEPSWLRGRRTAAFARYVEKGLPGPRHEAWRHTPTAPLTRTRFEPADPDPGAPPQSLAEFRSRDEAALAVCVNGRFSRELSRVDPSLAGVEVTSLREALRSDPAGIESLLGRALGEQAGSFAELNTAFAEDGVVVRIAPGVVLEKPVSVVHLAQPGERPTLCYLRTLVLAGRGSASRVLEVFLGPADRSYLVNSVTEVVAEDGARLDHYKLEQEGAQGLHVATLAVRLGRDAWFKDHAVLLGAALSRNDLTVRFSGEGGECLLDGLFVVDGKRVCDTHSRVEHATPRCTSRQLYKGILQEQARGIFNGLVVVAPGAQKTDATQTNKNLLLSREALVHSTPQLEILADDVKCKHGSTTGQVDPAALFYLRSRGIGESAARSLLTWAFAADLLRGIELAAVRRAAERRLQGQLPGFAGLLQEDVA